MLTHGNNNKKRPVYTLLKDTQTLINKKVNELKTTVIREELINKMKEIISNTFRTQSSIPDKVFAKTANSHSGSQFSQIIHPNI